MAERKDLEFCPRCEAEVSDCKVRCGFCGQLLDFDLSIPQNPMPKPPVARKPPVPVQVFPSRREYHA